MTKLDFFATWTHYADHLIPLFEELGDQAGVFYVSQEVQQYLAEKGIRSEANVAPSSSNPMIVSSNNDLRLGYIVHPNRKYILMEHGVGIVFSGNPSYAGGAGHRKHASLTLAPNQIVHNLTHAAYPSMPQEIIGTPKMDAWATKKPRPGPLPSKLKVCVSFHWDGSMVAAEAGNAFRHFKHNLPRLNRRYDMELFAHLHPKFNKADRKFFEAIGMRIEPSLEKVFDDADILLNDSSSIAFEFMLTGKPVILMNAPWFRRELDQGVRFWRYSDIGEQINHPDEMYIAIMRAYERLPEFEAARLRAQKDLYPYFGMASKVGARALRRFLETE